MNWKQVRRTAAKLFIWTAILFLGLLAIMSKFNTPDLLELQGQQLGLCIGVFLGLMTSVFYHVLPQDKKRERGIEVEKS